METEYSVNEQKDYVFIYYKTDDYGEPFASIEEMENIRKFFALRNPDKQVYVLPNIINIDIIDKDAAYNILIKMIQQIKPNILITEVDDGK